MSFQAYCKRAIILHGTDSAPGQSWFPWLKQKLERQGYEVHVPELPGNHMPNRRIYNDFIFSQGWDLTDGIVIGHSSGAVSVLNLLMDERCPHIRLGVIVGAWAGMTDADNERVKSLGMEPEQFQELFLPEGFDFERIKQKADELVFLHGDDDPYCPIEQAQWLAERTGSELVVVPNGHHLGTKFKELPELWNIIEPRISKLS